MPDVLALEKTYAASAIDMMQTYLVGTQPNVVRRIRQQKNGQEFLYFYTEKRYTDAGAWETEKPITQKEYDEVVDYAIDLGVENGFIQEGETAKESFIPQFDDTGL